MPTCLQKQGRETRINVRKKLFDPSLVENNMTLDIYTGSGFLGQGRMYLNKARLQCKGPFTWSGGPRSSVDGFFCFHALEDTKQKKPTH